MKTFYKLLGVALLVSTTNSFVWFALTYWAYLETKSVVSTSIVGGVFLIGMAISGFWLGSIVDHHKKKNAMLGSSVVSLGFFMLGFLLFISSPAGVFSSVGSAAFWALVLLLLCGSLSGGIYNIAIPTLVGLTVPEENRDKANGMFGTVSGISFGLTSIASGLVLGFLGMYWVLVISIICTLVAIALLALVPVSEKKLIHVEGQDEHKKIDIKGTIKVVKGVPGLFGLIFFTTFNNFLGGVFMSLMDAYGLTLVTVQVWGMLWGVLSFGFIFGGLYISKYGLGKNPLGNLFRINIVLWVICIFMTIQPSILLLAVGMFLYMCLVPFLEATEQTIFQKVVPPERLGRVFGFAHSIEQAASPLMAFMIGPIAQYVFIPFMITGQGVEMIGSWFGTGTGRGLALVFIFAGLVGLMITLIAMKTRSYRVLVARYIKE